jgi:hypothetical protein
VRIGQKGPRPPSGREELVSIDVQVGGDGELLEVVLALRLPETVASLLGIMRLFGYGQRVVFGL